MGPKISCGRALLRVQSLRGPPAPEDGSPLAEGEESGKHICAHTRNTKNDAFSLPNLAQPEPNHAPIQESYS